MISLDGASLFGSLFAKQHVSTGAAPAEATEGDRDRNDRRADVRTDTRSSAKQRPAGDLALYDRAGATAEAAAASDQTATAAEPDAELVPADAQAIGEGSEAPEPLFADILSAFETIAAFLTTLLETLSVVPESSGAAENTSNFALRYDMSFKLRVFQSILMSASDTSGEEHDDAVPPVIEDALDELVAGQQPPLEDVA